MENKVTVKVTYDPSVKTSKDLFKEVEKIYKLIPFWRRRKAKEIIYKYIEIERTAMCGECLDAHK